jgi:hypothetical protein
MAHVLGLSVLFQVSVGSIRTIEASTHIVHDYERKTQVKVWIETVLPVSNFCLLVTVYHSLPC